MLAFMVLSGQVGLYWSELMTARVLAICLPALWGWLRPSKMSVCDDGDGEGDSSPIVAYGATWREKSECSC